jgi:TPP-dependent pyruvate/acetoin dehydrogenase alpha subunit
VLKNAGMLDDKLFAAMREEAQQKVEQALTFGEASPEPDVSTIMDGVYA